VERNGTREVDTADLAAIKAQPESTFPQRPESSPISMPPKTRSQTARSRPPNPSSLVTLEEELRNLHVEDDRTSPRRPTQPSSPDYDPADERREAECIESHTTPRIRKKTRTIGSSQKDLVRRADPNDGRCLVTNRPDPVQSCHLVAQATDHETVRVYVSQIMRLYSLHPTRSSRSWSMCGGLNIKISTSTQGIT
jgi:hypothetical protein